MTGKGSTAYVGAEAIRMGIGFMMSSAKRDFTWNLTKRFLPKEGGGPDRSQIDGGFFITWIHGNEDGKSKRKVSFSGPKDPGYGSTSIMLAESAICIAMGECNDNYGVSSVASLIGTQLVDRLKKFEFKIDFEHIG